MKKLLITGGCGFVGRNIKPILDQQYDVTTCGLNKDNNIVANLVTTETTFPEKYDIILHACGKAHSVPKTEEERQAFSDVNYQGTVNLCRALEKLSLPESFIYLSSVAVYGCEEGEEIDENHSLDGKTPYALSKREAEEFLQSWCGANHVKLTILRLPLLAGPNPPGNLGAMINGIRTGKYLSIGGGLARKTMLMVEDIANLVPLIAERGGVYNVCDDYHPSFHELEVLISSQIGKIPPYSIPSWMAKALAMIGDCTGGLFPLDSMKLKKMTTSLTFNNTKVKREFGWHPLSVIDNFKI